MKSLLRIVAAAGLAMFATAALVAFATSAETPVAEPVDEFEGMALAAIDLSAPRTASEAELVAQMDRVIESQLREIKRQLNVTAID